MLTISMARGDIENISFTITDQNHQPINFVPDEITSTVKISINDRRFLFQKKLSSGTIIPYDSPGRYRFRIESEDTAELSFGTYAFDIEVISDSAGVHKTFFGNLELTGETSSNNSD